MSGVRHHFVSQGFLRGFASDDETKRTFIWVYDKRSGRLPRKKSIRSIAWAPNYYAQEREDGTTDLDSLETGFARTIDNEIPTILRSLEPRPGRKTSLSEQDRDALAFFLGISLTRVPSFRDGINAMFTKVAQIGLAHKAQSDTKLGDIVEKYGVKAKAKPWVSLRPMIELAQAIAASALTKK